MHELLKTEWHKVYGGMQNTSAESFESNPYVKGAFVGGLMTSALVVGISLHMSAPSLSYKMARTFMLLFQGIFCGSFMGAGMVYAAQHWMPTMNAEQNEVASA